MNGYIFFYSGQRVALYAKTLLDAKIMAVEHFKPPRSKQHMVHGALAEKDGEVVVHTAVD